MSYVIVCPFCSARIEVPDELADTTAACPACGQDVYLSREDAVEDADPALEKMRREAEESDRRRMDQLRMMAMIQQADARAEKRTKSVVSVLLWIFVWGPLIAIGGYLAFMCLFRVATGHW